ncbi:multidrug transporter [Cryptococcus neoformans C23]|uniref:Multidrug transporter n=2 Tax=Cryptococcus neoformans TaxID=5207 RepID=A0A854Q853_CRYNE|nr:multidrug transporter [Cryptococcus neoformans var. grubii H99]AUB27261.1 multidrug transporter [Cryptococcus neoformans var. grubii]OWZ35072.1 multidrug transporter [Cryptococcus neoformans var. grubii AD1-83a]OWZ40920.1 multidrug transporter [Cryptococcus neoformans var. grubii C23]OWZ51894.1 multidrug transporter [Cryptococcus neoformans var. grubii 125.91]OXC82725.1 multidrug transporter [Cryptococcus neoformans var. grubii AD1-7a]OXG14915.1 multidrug transporter [Cryptococcus neoforma|eukprot:XP_012051867.1 multidrug transporter [Cryptococcus neoformans var. grubii H99]
MSSSLQPALLSNQMSLTASLPSLDDANPIDDPNPRTACVTPNLSKLTLLKTHMSEYSPTTPPLSLPTRLDQPVSPLSTSTDILSPPAYPGSGTLSDPYIVDFLPSSPLNPYNWSKRYRWAITALIGVTALCPPFASVSYSTTVGEVVEAYGISKELAIAGISLFILGFGLGPLIWAPISELYGRQFAFAASYPIFTVFNLGTALSHNAVALLVTRFFAGVFGSSPLTNAGAQVGDMWAVNERALATSVFALAPFLGPVLGPIAGGYVTERCGYRWVYWIQFIYAGVMTILSIIVVPETYAPTILRRRARSLQAAALSEGKEEYYIAKYDTVKKSKREVVLVGLCRPFEMLFTEVIVGCLSIYGALIYGILYLFFTAFPIVFQQTRGWTVGESGLSFLGMGVGLISGVILNPFLSSHFYSRSRSQLQSHVTPSGHTHTHPPPEARLPVCCIGAILAPIGLFWFAWTSAPPVHWIVPIIACLPFGLAFLLIFTSMTNYLIDSYELYAASALAAQAVSRCIFGAIFPLFASQMYETLGLHWAGTLVAFFSLVCAPMPFLFHRYGSYLRRKSKYAPSIPSVALNKAGEMEQTRMKDEKNEDHSTVNWRRRRRELEAGGIEPEWAADAGLDTRIGGTRERERVWDVEKGVWTE